MSCVLTSVTVEFGCGYSAVVADVAANTAFVSGYRWRLYQFPANAGRSAHSLVHRLAMPDQIGPRGYSEQVRVGIQCQHVYCSWNVAKNPRTSAMQKGGTNSP